MSVSNFIKQCFDSDLDFSNIEVDEFITCVKKLSKILTTATDDSRKAVRQRKFNSLLANQVYLSERFNSKTIHDYYSFTCKEVQIDIVIRGSAFGVSVIGWLPDIKHLINLFNMRNVNDLFSFDWISEKNISNYVSNASNVWYFNGDTDHFGLNERGLNNIIYVWKSLIVWYMSINNV